MRVKEFMELYSDSNFHFMTSKGYLFLNSDQVKSILLEEQKEAAEEAKKVFGDVEIISLGQLPQECAFITDEMTQGAFEEKLAQIGDQVLAKIRVKD